MSVYGSMEFTCVCPSLGWLQPHAFTNCHQILNHCIRSYEICKDCFICSLKMAAFFVSFSKFRSLSEVLFTEVQVKRVDKIMIVLILFLIRYVFLCSKFGIWRTLCSTLTFILFYFSGPHQLTFSRLIKILKDKRFSFRS